MQLRSSSKARIEKPKQVMEKTSKKVTKKKPSKSISKVPAKADIKEARQENMSNGLDLTTILDIGDDIPDLTLLNQDGQKVSLKKASKKKRVLVLFAYPRASTPGCTRQVCGFRDNYDNLKDHAVLLGVSADGVSSQQKFHSKQHLPYDLLSDPQRQLIGLLGAKKTATAGIIRSYWIFVDGKLNFKKIKVSPEISVAETKEQIVKLIEMFSKK